MKKAFFTSAILLLGLVAAAQRIDVKSFRALPMDMTASSLEGKRMDQNGDVAALIKVVTSETGFTFEGGTLGIVDTKQRNGEIWVWVPRGLRKITILHQKLGVLRDWRFPIEIEAERTYEMVLITGKVETIVKEEVRQQYLVFQITPKDALLEVNEQMWPVSDGTARKFVNFGTYDYRVQAPNYYPDAGKATVDDPNNKCIVKVNLKPNYGWIEVKSASVQGADVYIDNALIGKAPCKSGNLPSGQHTVRIVKEMYEPYIERVTVKDEATVTVAPTLTADFARVTLKVDGDAEIWVNDERKGTGSWTGNLATGSYRVECRKDGHEATAKTIEITNAMDGETINLPAPKPIYGSLNVESTPDFAKIFIDGQAMGETPNFISEILIGQHALKLTKEGYADYAETVTITKGQRAQVNATLSNGKEIQFTCNVPNAQLSVDGKVVGQASGTYLLTYGSHTLKATASNYRDYAGSIQVSESSRTYSISMEPVRKDEETFTVNGVSFTMKLVEGGTFQMGATSEQGSDANDREKPVHNVTLSNYYIGETEVTQALWQAVMGSNPSNWKGDNLPVETVSWNDVQDFIHKLNQMTGKNFRLPTEAEWEYAARGGKYSKSYKYSGNKKISKVAWCTDNSEHKTHVVKTKDPNELGLYDMSGNVWEWCQDWYGNYSSSSQTNPTGPSTGSFRVLRGGSWYSNARSCRVASRGDYAPGNRSSNIGFRLVLPQ
ncbi:MAG: SUMF1/EgtB/PvdO family nonheme iron enzyme [Bacteroidales bacterium]|nr:SUMF1/EgtB/PvdO family nonheme iron enzyme [Bacteroidales bacterium]